MLNKILNAYDWYDHPEGLKFVETHRDEYRTSGHWLLLPKAISAFHRVFNNEEIWYIHQGSLILHIIDASGKLSTRRLGVDLEKGEEPVISVPINCWQAAELPEGLEYAFGSVACAPAFVFEQFEIAERVKLKSEYPEYAELIERLTLINE
ncbi:cupin domain-containing protein [Oscillatoria sp. FACHB-1406]|uniref:cupin domain-containing protein n=1 Tax=Oscillatoria sp. FACHB-1406 TaxID=2692846 RepID=UPI001686B362|nr:cupin domain-containing protein [Oscillatoria sp. FACHB-1406]